MNPSEKPEWPSLVCPGSHPMSLADIKTLCVDQFPLSTTRVSIFAGLESLIAILIQNGITAEIWVDGSFLTKKTDPDDVDIVICASGEQYDNGTMEVRELLDYLASADLKPEYHCHNFLVYEYNDENHPLHEFGKQEKADWLQFFGTDRRNRVKGLAVVKVGESE